MVSEELVKRWEALYGAYGVASKSVATTEPGDRAVARRMARASADVAAAWREMAAQPGMAWWAVAALGTAAQAFEFQARDWAARAKHEAVPSRLPHPQVIPPDTAAGGDQWGSVAG
ncbi:hypothetical protein [Actinophytocola xanthii]|uniref:Uncharacterized protein n=1 Tax=Actinophytocola xanthii TaxID=1912961 RepID=A0A1Q8CX46_9PSEU|nr:hypothetical protein [Actinophytocola xanthii]OLF18923.1 hypothetical protein BU204_03425 [Actinophytocola xanthii]